MMKKTLGGLALLSIILLTSCDSAQKTQATTKAEEQKTYSACIANGSLEDIKSLANEKGYRLNGETKEAVCNSLIVEAKKSLKKVNATKAKVAETFAAVTKILNKNAEQAHIKITVTTSNSDNKLLKNQKVAIKDITGTLNKLIAEKTTDATGRVVFTQTDGLKYVKSYAFFVNGENKGFSYRTDVKVEFEKDFQLKTYNSDDVVGDYDSAVKPAVVIVNDENSNALANQKVTLKRGADFQISVTTDVKGKAVFAEKLKKGTLYYIYVNGVKNGGNFVMPGQTRNVFIKKSAIVKPQ